MSAKIENLANLIRARREDGAKFVIMLGAGASADAGVPYMRQLITKILDEYDKEGEGDDNERFDRYWSHANKDERNSILKKYLDMRPSKGHEALARMIKDGWFDTILTFNYDDLLEQALDEIGAEHEVCVREKLKDDVFAEYMLDGGKGARVLKIHGSFKSARIFLGSLREMRKYPEGIADAFERITECNLLVCGYAFGDLCVTRAFTDREDGGRIYCVDPKGASDELKQLALSRLTAEQTFDGEDGRFDEFFPALEEALSRPSGTTETVDVPKDNPFKFIEGLYGDDRDLLFGREDTINEVVHRIESDNCRFINIYGEKKSGKSSFLRAGVKPTLEAKGYDVLYLRCLPSLEEHLIGMIASQPSLDVPITGLANAIEAIDAGKREKLVIILDQFERVIKSFLDERDEDVFIELYDELYVASKSIACLLLASRDERTRGHAINTLTYIFKLIERHRDDLNLIESRVELKDLKGEDVATLLAKLNIQANGSIPDEMQQKFADRVSADDEFTLAHIHSLCHLYVSDFMSKGKAPPMNGKRDVEDKLNLAINACDVMNLIDDLGLKEERILLRNLMKIVSPDSKGHIATHVRDSLYFLLTKPGYTARPLDKPPN